MVTCTRSAQDQAVKIFSMDGSGRGSTPKVPSLGRAVAVPGRRVTFFGNVATGRFPRPQWVTPTLMHIWVALIGLSELKNNLNKLIIRKGRQH